ncbi:glycosyltransferase family A protein [Bacillus haimaensis]|uniref:glycosyltransferase family 2 protein n=1 Tax=Bacillus haimaensis TaxID=3160967 RepID=UPI003AA99D5E
MNKVSVIIPTHDRAELLLQSLESINEQIVRPSEVIVVIDGANEKTERLLQGFKSKDYQLRVCKIENSKGACYARNLGAGHATGSILMFLDDDDTWEPDKIRSQLDVFDKNPEIGLVYSGKLVVYNTNRKKVVRKIPAIRSGNLYPSIFEDNHIGTTSSVALKKEVFEKAGGFDENLLAMQDYDLWIRCCKYTNIAHDNKYNVRYTIAKNAQNQISGKSENHHQALRYLFGKYKDTLEAFDDKYKKRFKSSRFLYLSKAVHRTRYIYSLKYSFKSFYYYPNAKAVAYLLPPFLLEIISVLPLKRK